MEFTDVILACITDYGSRVRGKGFPAEDLRKYVDEGVGLAPTNLMITCFGEIVDTPWGPRGDLLMMPDPATAVAVELGEDRPAERFILCSLDRMDGTPWPCCPRHWLRRGLEALEAEFGLTVNAAFEHEFHYSGVSAGGGNAYALDSFRQQGAFLHEVLHALSRNGGVPEMVMPEYAPQQFEVTNAAAIGLEAADRAVKLREIVRAIARAHGEKATFAPVMAANAVGNGVHIHFSLRRCDGTPVSYAPEREHGLSRELEGFVAGILAHMHEFIAMTAASNISYERLQPNRWSAAYNNLGSQDREAAIRICPLLDRPGLDLSWNFNVEYRAADATGNPYLVLGALVWAGLEGLRTKSTVSGVTQGDPGDLSESERERLGIRRLPTSLPEALHLMETSEPVRRWMGEEFLSAYLMNKRSELKLLDGLDLPEQIERYVACF
ncbi:MAG: glutamine synthetase [Hyphomicrobiales bacterium]|nr:glutamine synthetase [Hyphomicrobiales bacterium]